MGTTLKDNFIKLKK